MHKLYEIRKNWEEIKMTKIAINGFGRIGRLAFRQIFADDTMEVAAINDLTEPKMLAHLLKYDSVQGSYKGHTVTYDESSIDGKKITVYKEADPEKLPWAELGIDIVLECTGFFTSKAKSEAHLRAGAKTEGSPQKIRLLNKWVLQCVRVKMSYFRTSTLTASTIKDGF